ncbi:MAG: L,D-transpeptidase family protein, partial [Gammaproteobacteria bacterium]|nr:L,D-transpeptidase family protein [Gammaproteobacteria bacterium]
MNKLILAIIFAILLTVGNAMSSQNKVNAIVVEKTERKLHLLTDWEITHTFAISLGQNPVGHKQKEGDSRTPEGLYYINARNPNSRFFSKLRKSF